MPRSAGKKTGRKLLNTRTDSRYRCLAFIALHQRKQQRSDCFSAPARRETFPTAAGTYMYDKRKNTNGLRKSRHPRASS